MSLASLRMTMPGLQFDPQISIEGIATAVGVIVALLGGISGFLIGVFRSARAQRTDRRERADRLTIMETLEKDLFNGLTEAQIKEFFRSGEMEQFRIKAGATKPSKLSDHDFSRYLRDLQWNNMIDQIEKDRYRLRTSLLSFEQRRARQQEFVSALTKIVSQEKIVSVLECHYDKLKDYDRADVIRAFVSLGRTDMVKRLSEDLDSKDPDVALSAARTLLAALDRD